MPSAKAGQQCACGYLTGSGDGNPSSFEENELEMADLHVFFHISVYHSLNVLKKYIDTTYPSLGCNMPNLTVIFQCCQRTRCDLLNLFEMVLGPNFAAFSSGSPGVPKNSPSVLGESFLKIRHICLDSHQEPELFPGEWNAPSKLD